MGPSLSSCMYVCIYNSTEGLSLVVYTIHAVYCREEERQRELERQQRELERLEREKREQEAAEMRRKVSHYIIHSFYRSYVDMYV